MYHLRPDIRRGFFPRVVDSRNAREDFPLTRKLRPLTQVVPWGLRKMLNWIKTEYDNVPVVIAENGFSDNGEVEDSERIRYLVVSTRSQRNVAHNLIDLETESPQASAPEFLRVTTDSVLPDSPWFSTVPPRDRLLPNPLNRYHEIARVLETSDDVLVT